MGAGSHRRERGTGHHGDPILYSTDLGRTAAYYGLLGLRMIERHDMYLVMRAGPCGTALCQRTPGSGTGPSVLYVPDAGKLWTELRGSSVAVLDWLKMTRRASGSSW